MTQAVAPAVSINEPQKKEHQGGERVHLNLARAKQAANITMTQTHLSEPNQEYTLQVGEGGNLLLPVPVQQQLKLQLGDRLTMTVEADGSLRLVSLRQQVQKLQGLFKDIAPGVSLADELIQERREEARRESEK